MNAHVRDQLLALTPDPATTLPGSPVDKQLAILTDSTTSPTYQWKFRYHSGSSQTDKWEYLGGAPFIHEIDAAGAGGSGSYADAGTVGPTITIPRSGVYLFSFGATMQAAQSGDYDLYAALKFGSAATSDADSIRTYSVGSGPSQTIFVSGARTRQKAVTAADVVKVQYKSISGTSQFTNRWMTVTPVRVS